MVAASTRTSTANSLPPPSLRDRAASVLETVSGYFQVPSSEGFSAYRTGWVAHLAFSTLVAAGAYAICSSLGLAPLRSALTALGMVLLLWWVGVRVGIASHYTPLLMLAAIAVLLTSLLAARIAPPLLFGLPIAFAAHALMLPFSSVLRRLARAMR